MYVQSWLEELEVLIRESGRVPFTNKVMLEEEEALRLLEAIRRNLPVELGEAKRIVTDRQHILSEAEREARNIVEQAKAYAAKLTDEHIIARNAQEQAAEIIQQAKKTAKEIQVSANQYAEEVLGKVEQNLERALEVIRKGKSELHSKK